MEEGNKVGFITITDNLKGDIEQIGDFNGDGIDDVRLRVGTERVGYLAVSVDGQVSWQSLGNAGLGDEWNTKFSAIC